MSEKKKVLLVDDSFFVTSALERYLNEEPSLGVVGVAHNGFEAVKKAKELKPDVVLMDLMMSDMDGSAAVKEIMRNHPVPILIFSGVSEEGAKLTFDALDAGAVDFIPKPKDGKSLLSIKDELVEKILAAAETDIGKRWRITSCPSFPYRFICVGVSTGGPNALSKLLSSLPGNFPVAILVVQHISELYTAHLAKRLDSISLLEVKEAEAGALIEPGTVYIAPGDYHMTVSNRGKRLRLSKAPPVNGFRPSVDVLFKSAAESGCKVMGIILTGMGSDGLEGARAIKEKGGFIVAQNKESCIVYGMPRVVVEAGLADKVLSIEKIGPYLNSLCLEN